MRELEQNLHQDRTISSQIKSTSVYDLHTHPLTQFYYVPVWNRGTTWDMSCCCFYCRFKIYFTYLLICPFFFICRHYHVLYRLHQSVVPYLAILKEPNSLHIWSMESNIYFRIHRYSLITLNFVSILNEQINNCSHSYSDYCNVFCRD